MVQERTYTLWEKKLDMLVEFFKAEDLIVGMQTWANTLPVKWLCSGSVIR